MNALGQYRFAVHGVIMGKRPQPWLDIETALASLVNAAIEIQPVVSLEELIGKL
jgi:hypothetical protein